MTWVQSAYPQTVLNRILGVGVRGPNDSHPKSYLRFTFAAQQHAAITYFIYLAHGQSLNLLTS